MTDKASSPCPPNNGEGRRGRTRAKIIDGAYRVFARNGYDAVRVEQILLESEVARATFYQHFTDKQQVALAIIERMWTRAEAIYSEFAALPVIDLPIVRTWLGDVAGSWARHYQEVALLVSELPEQLTAGARGHEERLVDSLIGDGRHWPFPQAERRCRASLMIFLLERAMLEFFSGGWEIDRDVLLDTLSSIWTQTLGVDAELGDRAT